MDQHAEMSAGSSDGLEDVHERCVIIPQFRHNHPQRRVLYLPRAGAAAQLFGRLDEAVEPGDPGRMAAAEAAAAIRSASLPGPSVSNLNPARLNPSECWASTGN